MPQETQETADLRSRGTATWSGSSGGPKDQEELKRIRKAIRRAEESFRELKKYIRPGARERDLALMLELLMREKGARKAAFDTIIASGGNGAMPHAIGTDRRIKQGDLVTFDFGAEADGYFSDITRTYCVGKPTARQREIHALVQAAQAAAMQINAAGIACKCVSIACCSPGSDREGRPRGTFRARHRPRRRAYGA